MVGSAVLITCCGSDVGPLCSACAEVPGAPGDASVGEECLVTTPPSRTRSDRRTKTEVRPRRRLTEFRLRKRTAPNGGTVSQGEEGMEEQRLSRCRRPSVAQDAAVGLLIKGAMKQDPICCLLEEFEMDSIVACMEYFEFRRDSAVVKQDEIGTAFFVLATGMLQVRIDGRVVNTISPGQAFGAVALLYKCPRTASVVAMTQAGAWGARGAVFHRVLQEHAQRRSAENMRFLESATLFRTLNTSQRASIGDRAFSEVVEAGARIVTEGEAAVQVCFLRSGELEQVQGGSVQADGTLSGGEHVRHLSAGDSVGGQAAFYGERHKYSVVAKTRSELLKVGVQDLKDALGGDFGACLERNMVFLALKRLTTISEFSTTQQQQIARQMRIVSLQPGESLEDDVCLTVVIRGEIASLMRSEHVCLRRGDCHQASWMADSQGSPEGLGRLAKGASGKVQFPALLGRAELAEPVEQLASCPGNTPEKSPPKRRVPPLLPAAALRPEAAGGFKAGGKGARVAILTRHDFVNMLQELGLQSIHSAQQAVVHARKLKVTKKVHILRHLSQEQRDELVQSFVLREYRKGDLVINLGEMGTTFFVIASGEVKVAIGGAVVRTLRANAYFGERALLFDEPRTASIEVSSSKAELWAIDKATFLEIVKGNMQQELMHRIALQDTSMELQDLRHVRVIGAGGMGVVSMVERDGTGVRYALKRIPKCHGEIPEEAQRECSLLADNVHPFVVHLVKSFETDSSLYLLQELVTGGDLFSAIQAIPRLTRSQAQFYTASLVLIFEELAEHNIVYRDLKPENVMLDQQGYVKLIDFGVAKRIAEGECRTYSTVGTPEYMAPEVMRGRGYGTEADLWSIGVVLYELACGHLPFGSRATEPYDLCLAVQKEELGFPKSYEDIPGQTLMKGLLTRSRKDRLGAGVNGYKDVRDAEFFQVGHDRSDIFEALLGRQIPAPIVPEDETYQDDIEEEPLLNEAGQFL